MEKNIVINITQKSQEKKKHMKITIRRRHANVVIETIKTEGKQIVVECYV